MSRVQRLSVIHGWVVVEASSHARFLRPYPELTRRTLIVEVMWRPIQTNCSREGRANNRLKLTARGRSVAESRLRTRAAAYPGRSAD